MWPSYYVLSFSEFERKVKEGEEKKESLLRAKEKLENQIAEMIKSSGDSSAQLSTLNEELQSRERNLADLQTELSKSGQTVKQLQDNIELLTSEAKRCTEEAQESHRQAIKAMTSEIDSLKLTIENLHLENKELQALKEKCISDLVSQHQSTINELKQNLQVKEEMWKVAQVKQTEELQQQVEKAKVFFSVVLGSLHSVKYFLWLFIKFYSRFFALKKFSMQAKSHSILYCDGTYITSLTCVLESKNKEVELMTEEMRGLKVEKDTLFKEADALKLGKESLLSKIIELESCINVLQQEKMEHLALFDEVKAEKGNIVHEKQELEKQYNILNSSSQALASDKEKLIAELNNAKQELLKISLVCEDLQTSITAMDAAMKELQLGKDALLTNYTELQNNNQVIMEEQMRLGEEKVHLSREKDEIIDMLKKNTEDLMVRHTALEKEVDSLEADKALFSNKCVDLEKKMDAIMEEKKMLTKTIAEVTSEREDLVVKQNQLNTEIENLFKEKESLAKEHCSIAAELTSIKSQLDASVQENVTLAGRRDELLEALAILEEDKQKLQECQSKIIDEKVSIIKENDEIIHNLKGSKDDVEGKYTDLVKEMSGLKAENETALVRNLELEDKLSQIVGKHDELLKTTDALSSERNNFASQENELNIKVMELTKEKNKLAADHSEMTTKVAVMENALDHSEKANVELQITNESLTKLLEEIKTSNSVSDSERFNLLQEKESLLSFERKLTTERDNLLKQKEELAGKYQTAVKEAKCVQDQMIDEINNLKNTKDHISFQLNDVEKQLESVSKEKMELQSLNIELQSREQLVIAELECFKTRLEDAEASNLLLSQEKGRLLQDTESLNFRIVDAEKLSDNLKQTIESLKLIQEQTQRDKSALEEQHGCTLVEKQSLLEDYNKCCLDKDLLIKHRDELQKQILELESGFKSFEQRLAEEKETFRNEKDSLELKCVDFQKSLVDVTEEKEQIILLSKELQCKYEALLEQKENVDNSVNTLLQEKESLELEKNSLCSKLNELNEDLASLKNSKEELQDLYRNLSKTLEELHDQLGIKEREIVNLQEEKSRLLLAQESLEKANVTVLAEKEATINNCNKMSGEMAALTKSKSQATCLAEQLEIQCRSLMNEKEELMFRFNELQGQQNKKEAKINEVPDMLSELKNY
ncbi:unnamed protein product [Ranitomeya imitator]|uniref:Uncharacterized protein n=1 Tax=Ranitomeya imitator TaxID=111125 RepID=A0ABN9L2R2_9NEOB|nr:unnamed protein product [Ranitomeya imitator]